MTSGGWHALKVLLKGVAKLRRLVVARTQAGEEATSCLTPFRSTFRAATPAGVRPQSRHNFGVELAMTVLTKLATALNRRDEVPNQALAQEIVVKNDRGAVRELVENLSHKDKNIQSDCIKVLYEIGERQPQLIARHSAAFGALLGSANNRLVWGAVTALDHIALTAPKSVSALLPKIIAAAKTGSVITRDHAVGILTKLGTLKEYADTCLPLLLEQLKTCPNNQLPMYAEMSLAMATPSTKPALCETLNERLPRLEKDSQKKRVAKVLKRLASAP